MLNIQKNEVNKCGKRNEFTVVHPLPYIYMLNTSNLLSRADFF